MAAKIEQERRLASRPPASAVASDVAPFAVGDVRGGNALSMRRRAMRVAAMCAEEALMPMIGKPDVRDDSVLRDRSACLALSRGYRNGERGETAMPLRHYLRYARVTPTVICQRPRDDATPSVILL